MRKFTTSDPQVALGCVVATCLGVLVYAFGMPFLGAWLITKAWPQVSYIQAWLIAFVVLAILGALGQRKSNA